MGIAALNAILQKPAQTKAVVVTDHRLAGQCGPETYGGPDGVQFGP
jgi:hypothetical protein